MIPKIIHYCWFGRGQMSPLGQRCIKSWKKYHPEYEIMEWNEDNFDLNMYPYALEAYKERKFAFTADVCRLYALKKYGGIYVDTDIEFIKPIDESFLSDNAFSGTEDGLHVAAGIMGSVKDGQWITDLLDYYKIKSFYSENGDLDTTTIVQIITDFLNNDKGLFINNTIQNIDGYCKIYPRDYFYPKDIETKKTIITPNTLCIHHYEGSWSSVVTWKRKVVRLFIGDRRAKLIGYYYKRIKGEL